MTIRPFYVIAHHCNQIGDVKKAVVDGANAVECDITYFNNVWLVAHDMFEIVNGARDLPSYLTGIRETLRKHEAAMLIFDCKTPVAGQVSHLFEIIRTFLTSHVPINVLISIASYDKRAFFKPLKTFPLQANEGVGIDQDDDSKRVTGFFHALGVSHHAYANGVATAGIEVNIPNSIMEAVARRAISGHLKLVYVWTLAERGAMRNYMRMGVDGIMVNDIKTLRATCAEDEFKHRLRLATVADRPFISPPAPAYILDVKTGDVGSGGTDALLRFFVFGPGGHQAVYRLRSQPAGLFEAGDTNRVTIFGDVGAPKKLRVSRNSSGNAPGWYLSNIKVRKTKGPSPSFAVKTVKFDQWIESETPVDRVVPSA